MSLFDHLVAGVLPVVPKPIVWHFSQRYIAGVRDVEAIATVREELQNGSGAGRGDGR